jgi:hypothetical protein
MQLTLDEVHETRDLYLVVLSRRAVNDFNLHGILRSASINLTFRGWPAHKSNQHRGAPSLRI